jgi:hypothetical protein
LNTFQVKEKLVILVGFFTPVNIRKKKSKDQTGVMDPELSGSGPIHVRNKRPGDVYPSPKLVHRDVLV